jgi:hypothetical protein
MDLNDFLDEPWYRAWNFFEEGDPRPLAQLVRERSSIPMPVREVLADLLTTQRKKGKARTLLNPDHVDALEGALGLLQVDPVVDPEGNWPSGYPRKFESWRRGWIAEAIAAVVKASGAREATVRQKLRQLLANRKRIGLRNRETKRRMRLALLGKANNPFALASNPNEAASQTVAPAEPMIDNSGAHREGLGMASRKIGRDAETGKFKPVKDAEKDKKGSIVQTLPASKKQPKKSK